MSDTRYLLLKGWLSQAIVDHPDIIKNASGAVDVYLGLYEIWLEDCQKAMKSILTNEVCIEKSEDGSNEKPPQV